LFPKLLFPLAQLCFYDYSCNYQTFVSTKNTAVCKKMFDLAFYSSKTTILRVIGGVEGVLPHPHKCGSK